MTKEQMIVSIIVAIIGVIGASIGGGFAFSESEPQIEKTSEEGYSILAEYDNYGALECMDIGIKKEWGESL